MNFNVGPEERSPQDFARIEGLSVPYIINSICKSGGTGVLHFIKGDVKKSLHIKGGNIIFATSSEWDDRLSEILIKNGKVSYKDLEEAVAKLGEGRRLGSILAESSVVRPEDLVEAVLEQVKTIIFSIFCWKNGYYRFVEGELPTNELITLNLSTFEIIFQGAKQVKDFKILLKALGSLKKRFVLSLKFDKKMTTLMEDDEMQIIDALKKPSSAEEIQEQTNLDTMTVMRSLVALKITGIIEDEPSPVLQAFQKSSIFRNTLENYDIINVIGHIARNRQKGALYINSESLQAGLLLKDGKLVAMYTPDEKKSFLCFLILKAGSEQSKYLRTLLQTSEDEAECMSAIENEFTEEDLQEYENQFGAQLLTEIVMLKEGEVVFLDDEELPSPGISLNLALENLIMEYMVHIDNWVRVRKGCGELDTILRITPAFLDVMDRIPVSKELWDVVSRLQNPMSIREILSTVEMKEFEMCRLLWALEATGIIKRVEASEIEIEAPQESMVPHAEPESEVAEETVPEDVEEVAASDEYRQGSQSVEEAALREHEKISPQVAVETAPQELIQEPVPEEEEIQIDESILKEIKRFNEKQKYIYEKVKIELGAGARNFINYCRTRIEDGLKNAFADLAIEITGEWNPSDLGKRITLNQIDDCRSDLDGFIAIQIEMVGNLLSKAKEEELEKGIREIEKRQVEIE